MKMKSLLLGAAGMLAATGVQAADLPVAPEPVDYVRVCDAFGAGFFYIPGTETCLRVSGRVRAEYRVWGDDGHARFGAFGARGPRGRGNDRFTTRARAYLMMDARTNTEFGLLRTYYMVWWTGDTGGGTGGATTLWRAFIQWGGLTAGRTASFFDFYTGDTYESVFDQSLSDTTTNVLAYTAAFGNGFSATVSIEDASRRRYTILPLFAIGVDGYGAHWWPDLVANVRVDQGWGSAQLMGALHDVRDGIGAVDDSIVGWAVGAGVTFNLPMIGAGDSISLQATYSDGAVSYAAPSVDGWIPAWDAVRRPGGRLAATEAWSIGGGFTHFWMPGLSTGVTVTYLDVDQFARIADFEEWDVQANLVWRPAAGFQIGVEVEYQYVDPSFRRLNDHDDIVGLLRFQRTF